MYSRKNNKINHKGATIRTPRLKPIQMDTKHTQGDLSINYGSRPSRLMENFSSHNFAHSIGRFKGIAETFGFAVGDTKEKAEANAKLIASAPEMLAALHDISVNLRAIMDGTPNIAIGSSLDKVNRALKKASDVELKNVDYTDAPDVKLTRALT